MQIDEMFDKKNYVSLYGMVDSEIIFSHEVYNEKYYTFILKIKRLSEIYEYINITISDRLLLNQVKLFNGQNIFVAGQLRSYNSYTSLKSHLILTVFVKSFEIISKDLSNYDNPNYIVIDGFICKPPIYRVTPFGREIADILVAVNRTYNKSDYLKRTRRINIY